MRNIRLVIWGLAAVFAVTLATLYVGGYAARDEGISVAGIGGPFRLASSNGGIVDSKDLLGKPYGVFFGFTHCPEVCPTTMYEMTRTLKDLGDGAKDFRLFFITVDPDRDTAAMLKDYLSNFDRRIEALVPTVDELPKVAKAFRAIYEKVPASDGEYTMNHTATIYLMNREGQFTSSISYGEATESRIAKIKNLIAGR